MKVCVIGLGKIGLPTAVQYASKGATVIGVDKNKKIVDLANKGISYIKEEPFLQKKLKAAWKKGKFKATVNLAKAVSESDFISVAVPLIVDKNKKADYSIIEGVSKKIGKNLAKDSTVIFETTMPVGDTRKKLAPLLEKSSKLIAGKDFFVVYSPERVNNGDVFLDLKRYPKIVSGINEKAAKKGVQFYKKVLDARVLNVGLLETAEMIKLCGMTYRDTNIALANEYARICSEKGLDVTKIIEGANTIPHTHILSPGIGVGGHCAPVYPHFLIQKAKEQGLDLELLKAARKVNDSNPAYYLKKLKKELNGLKGKNILLLGLSYRQNVKQTSFAPSLEIIRLLKKEKARVFACDPLFEKKEIKALGAQAVELNNWPTVNAVILMSFHRQFKKLDLKKLKARGARIFLDGRNAVDGKKIERLKMKYIGIGR